MRTCKRLQLSLLLASTVLLGCTSVEAQAAPCERPGGPSFRDEFWRINGPAHALNGVVLKGEASIAIEPGDCARSPLQQLIVEVWQVLRAGGVVLLGEVHDNPQHHLVREDILWPRWDSAVAVGELRPGAVFEHIRADQKTQLALFYKRASSSRGLLGASDLLETLGWKETGWPAAEIFHPLYDAALWARMPIVTGDPGREQIKALAGGNRGGLSEAEVALVKVGNRLPHSLVNALNEELVASHCGVMPASAFSNMNVAQRYRDAHLARALVDAAETNGAAFLMAGNGHVRTDRGVPWYVQQMAPRRKVVSVTLLEVTEGATDPATYLPRDLAGKVASDYVLFTPRTVRADPCEQMRERAKSKKS